MKIVKHKLSFSIHKSKRTFQDAEEGVYRLNSRCKKKKGEFIS